MAKLVSGDDAAKRGKPGKVLVDYYDAGGARHVLSFTDDKEGRKEAEKCLARVTAEADGGKVCQFKPTMRIGELLDWCLEHKKTKWKKDRTLDLYHRHTRLYLKPALGRVRVQELTTATLNGIVKNMVSKNEEETRGLTYPTGVSYGTVRSVIAFLRSCLNRAVRHNLIAANPAASLFRDIDLDETSRDRASSVKRKALTQEQRDEFLALARELAPRWYPTFVLLAFTGMRIGEACTLHLDDFRFDVPEDRREQVGGTVAVNGTYGMRGEKIEPKTSMRRAVEMTPFCAQVVRRQITALKEMGLKRGRPVTTWVPPLKSSPAEKAGRVRLYTAPSILDEAFRRVAEKMGLGDHITVHSLRHTYATLALSANESLPYVQQQLGHSSIQMTNDLYGSWIPKTSNGAAARLDGSLEARLRLRAV